MARLTASKMSESLGKPVVVLNVPGASGSIATMRLINALPDGYTLEIVTPREISTATLVNPNITYDVERDFSYIALGGRSPIVVAGGPTLKNTKTFADLVAEARKRPKGLTYATSGAGSPQNFLGELIKQRYGISLVHVPFSGGTGGLLEVLGGNVDITIITLSSALQYIRVGQSLLLTALPTRSARRSRLKYRRSPRTKSWPMSTWASGTGSLVRPRRLPKLRRVSTSLSTTPSRIRRSQAKLHEHATVVVADGTPADFEAYARRDIAFYRSIVNETHIADRQANPNRRLPRCCTST